MPPGKQIPTRPALILSCNRDDDRLSPHSSESATAGASPPVVNRRIPASDVVIPPPSVTTTVRRSPSATVSTAYPVADFKSIKKCLIKPSGQVSFRIEVGRANPRDGNYGHKNPEAEKNEH